MLLGFKSTAFVSLIISSLSLINCSCPKYGYNEQTRCIVSQGVSGIKYLSIEALNKKDSSRAYYTINIRDNVADQKVISLDKIDTSLFRVKVYNDKNVEVDTSFALSVGSLYFIQVGPGGDCDNPTIEIER